MYSYLAKQPQVDRDYIFHRFLGAFVRKRKHHFLVKFDRDPITGRERGFSPGWRGV
jgi:hypothetical protein